jgi:hypothetical protein
MTGSGVYCATYQIHEQKRQAVQIACVAQHTQQRQAAVGKSACCAVTPPPPFASLAVSFL